MVSLFQNTVTFLYQNRSDLQYATRFATLVNGFGITLTLNLDNRIDNGIPVKT